MILSLADAQRAALTQGSRIPTEYRLDQVRPGWFVKVLADPPGEKLWLCVTSRTPDGYAGLIASRPLSDTLAQGLLANCSRRHVFDVMEPL